VLKAFKRYPFQDIDGHNLIRAQRSSSAASSPKEKPSSSAVTLEKEIQELGTLVKLNEGGLQIPNAGNGGVSGQYYWNQSLEEVTIFLVVPEAKVAKDFDVQIAASSLEVRLKDGEVLLSGYWPGSERVRVDECLWSLERGSNTMIISLEKTREAWWDCALAGGPKIDTTQVDSTKRVEDYDEATQAQIRKIMFDQQQKAKGLPTSDEMYTDEILEKTQGLPGRPF